MTLQLLPKYIDMSINVLILKTANVLHANNWFLPWTETSMDDNRHQKSNAYDWHTKKDLTTALKWEREQNCHKLPYRQRLSLSLSTLDRYILKQQSVLKVLCLRLTHQKGWNNSIELRTSTILSLSFLLDKGWVRNFQLWTDTSVDDNCYQKSNAYNWHTNNSIELRMRTKLSFSLLIDKVEFITFNFGPINT